MPHRTTLARAAPRAVYVSAGSLLAAQWRAYLARRALAEGERVAFGSACMPYRAFAAELWDACRGRGDPILLSPRQSRALWRQIVAESPEGGRLLGTDGPAAWAEDAWQTAAAFEVDLEHAARRVRGADFAAFVGWSRTYRNRLQDAGWIDAALVDGLLAERIRRPAPPLVLADFEPLPAQRRVLERLRAVGTPIETVAPPSVSGRASVLRCADPREELSAAAEWAAHALAAAPDTCIAIVVPDLAALASDVHRMLVDALGAIAGPVVGADFADRVFISTSPASADARPLVGAVLNALELLTPAAGFATFSRWLRSPFFHDGPTRAAAAAFETRLRRDTLAQVPFLDAYRHAGLDRRLRAALPDAAARVDAALALLDDPGRRRSPAAWAALWPNVVDALGGACWRDALRAADAERALYEEAILELARLTPIVGAMTASESLAELEAGMSREALARWPISGVHVLADIDDVGPGYAGLWVAGATDARVPRPVELRPFLPPALQIEAGFRYASPQDALQRSVALLERLTTRVPDVIYSWPEHVRDEPATPSPLLRALPAYSAAYRNDAARRSRSRGDAPGHPRRRERLPDPAPALAGEALPGGVAALNTQSGCPLRAFCEHRLGAESLPAVERGLPPAERGRILHRALERFFRRFDSWHALDATPAGELSSAMRREALRAASDSIGRGHPLLDAFIEIEAERARDVLAALVARERERAPFRVDSLEVDETLELGGRRLRMRLDRIDALDSGGLAVIDYKTGRAPRPGDWLGPRLRDVQLPAYAAAVGSDRLAALVVAVLRTDRAAYSGLWETGDAFPGRGRVGTELRLAELAEIWRDAIAALVAEYAAGDARLFVDGAEAAAGPYAPLTRVYALLGRLSAPVDATPR